MKKSALGWVLVAILGSGLALAGCSSDSSSGTAGGGGMGGTPGATVSVGGIAWGFTLPGQGGYDRIVGAAISILEMPELSTTGIRSPTPRPTPSLTPTSSTSPSKYRTTASMR